MLERTNITDPTRGEIRMDGVPKMLNAARVQWIGSHIDCAIHIDADR